MHNKLYLKEKSTQLKEQDYTEKGTTLSLLMTSGKKDIL